MNARIAKKVVTRFAMNPGSYNRDQIEDAHRILGRDISTEQMARWDAAVAAEKEDGRAHHAADMIRARANVRRRAASKDAKADKKAKAAARKADAIALAEKQAQMAKNVAAANAEAAKKKLPQETVVQVGAVEAKIEAGEDGVLGTDDDTVTLQKAGTARSEMTVTELKALAKTKGLKGYSKLKKDELLAALDGL